MPIVKMTNGVMLSNDNIAMFIDVNDVLATASVSNWVAPKDCVAKFIGGKYSSIYIDGKFIAGSSNGSYSFSAWFIIKKGTLVSAPDFYAFGLK